MAPESLLEEAFRCALQKQVIPISLVVRKRGDDDYLAILQGYLDGVAVIAFASGVSPESAVAHLSKGKFRRDKYRD